MKGRNISNVATMRQYLFGALLVTCALLGGSSRATVPGLLVLRPVIVLFLGAFLLLPGAIAWRSVRVPLALLGAFAATMLIQLVPLPPSWWVALPGHAPLAPSLALAGDALTWRPISLDPDMTLNALVALLPAFTVIVGYAGLDPARRRALPVWLAGIAIGSALLGLAQIASGGQGAAYFFRNTSFGLPVGLFANRNHQAVFLALAVPVLWFWARTASAPAPVLRLSVALGATLLFVPMILMTGSRAGIMALAAALLLTPWLARLRLPRGMPRARRRLLLTALAAGALLVAGLIAYTVVAGQALSLDRLNDMDGLSGEKRLRALPVLLRMLSDFFPFGLGHGAFEPAFRMYEPDALLMATYFNRAHNDPLEVAMSGGLPAIAVMGALLIWLATRLLSAWRGSASDPTNALARLGGAVATGWLLASIADYPLRTPLAAAMFMLCCLWLEDGFQARRATAA
ncbi:O-antigen ligase family protein [Sphingomonas sp. Leaf25]|uniref:O-antigen ligase family protein n=1 Tax=Sphingomonas sp. Leaf25 TaxID=1735692 RepID=UPI0006F88160|nr:O-antigen ligase family protein [Sphingomonas sp. Leaf25]KQN00005.1 hypothetical protein ASE78_17705 [Sphingomonas sp. Leaf25]